METFNAEIGIGHRDTEEWNTIDAVVDAGASITSAPASLLRKLGIERRWAQSLTFADGATREMEIAEARVRTGGREVTTLVLFNHEGSMPVLGALALEGMSLSVDPAAQRLVPVERGLARDSAIGDYARSFPANSEWAIGQMPAMPLNVGLAMVHRASMERYIRNRDLDSALVRQQRLAVQEAANKWQAQQSQRKNEAAQRFFVRAQGWAAIGFALGVGSVATLVIEHLLLT